MVAQWGGTIRDAVQMSEDEILNARTEVLLAPTEIKQAQGVILFNSNHCCQMLELGGFGFPGRYKGYNTKEDLKNAINQAMGMWHKGYHIIMTLNDRQWPTYEPWFKEFGFEQYKSWLNQGERELRLYGMIWKGPLQ